jgi:hypothetical protein
MAMAVAITNNRSSEHLSRTKEPEVKQGMLKTKKAQAMRASAFCYRLDMLMQTRSYYYWYGLWCLR